VIFATLALWMRPARRCGTAAARRLRPCSTATGHRRSRSRSCGTTTRVV